jgi:hypothetical protein
MSLVHMLVYLTCFDEVYASRYEKAGSRTKKCSIGRTCSFSISNGRIRLRLFARRVVTLGSSSVPASPTPVVDARVARAAQPMSRDRSVVESLGHGRPQVQIQNGYGGSGSTSGQADIAGRPGKRQADQRGGAGQGVSLTVTVVVVGFSVAAGASPLGFSLSVNSL